MKHDTFESLVPGPKCSGPKSIGPKYFRAEVYKWAEVFSGPKLFPGRSCFWAKVYKRAEVSPGRSCFGPKYFRAEVFPGQSIFGPKWVSGQSCLWAKLGVSRLWHSMSPKNSNDGAPNCYWSWCLLLSNSSYGIYVVLGKTFKEL